MSRILNIGLILWMAVCTGPERANAVPRNRVVPSPKTYYDSLADIRNARNGGLHRFRNLVLRYPEFDQAYLLLYYTALRQHRDAELVPILDFLSQRPDTRSRALWIQAKYAFTEHDDSTAYALFGMLFRQPQVSPLWMQDAAAFCFETGIPPRDFISDVCPAMEQNNQDRFLFYTHLLNHEYGTAAALIQAGPYPVPLEMVHDRGKALYRLAQVGQAAEIWQEGLDRAVRQGNLYVEALLLNDLGLCCQRRNRFDEALAFYMKSDTLADRILDYVSLEMNAGYRGNTAYIQGRFEDAVTYYRQAIQYAQSVREKRNLAVWFRNLGLALRQCDDFYGALLAFHESGKWAEDCHDMQNCIQSRMSEADLFAYLKLDELALEQIDRCLLDAENLKDPKQIQRIKLKKADLYVQQGKIEIACECYSEYIDYLDAEQRWLEKAYWTGRMADACAGQGEIRQAQKLYQDAIRTSRMADSKLYESWYLNALAAIDVKNGRVQDAMQKYRTILQRSDSLQAELFVEANLGLAGIYLEQSALDTAIAYFRKSAQCIETCRERMTLEPLQVGYFSKFAYVYRAMVNCYQMKLQRGEDGHCLDSLLTCYRRARSRSLRHSENAPGRLSGFFRTGTQVSEYRNACRQLEDCQRALRTGIGRDADEDSLKMLNARCEALKLTLLNDRIKCSDTPGQVPVRRDVRPDRVLFEHSGRPNDGLILYHITGSNSFALVITDRDTVIVPLAIHSDRLLSQVDSLVAPFHRSPDSIVFHAFTAWQLYLTLVRPVERAVALPATLTLVPDLCMVNLPMEILLTQKPDKPVYSLKDDPEYSHAFLIHHYAFSYDYMASFNNQSVGRHGPAGSRKTVVFANPTYNQAGMRRVASQRSGLRPLFEPLPFTEQEARRIQNICSRTELYTRDRANERELIRSGLRCSILHLASHATIDPVFPEFSGLILSLEPGSGKDGILMGYEIADLRMACDLVTLSACETGCGRLVPGEGVLGLPHAFLQAGARSVLMSLWKVDDRFTADFMPYFYERCVGEGESKSEALVHTKRYFLKNTGCEYGDAHIQHPFFWASFMLVGDQSAFPDTGYPAVLWAILICLILILVFKIRRSGFRLRRLS
ncbi:CHAT domain-containing protein [bacterium]|nr:CHAT domain-containing protein [bacterium]